MIKTSPTDHSSHIRIAVRRALIAAAASTATLGSFTVASAAEAEAELPTVIVTGSRILRSETEASVPVQVISAEAIAEQGSQNIADILQEMPAFGTAGISRANSNFAVNANGVSTVNLRNAGDSRTLVLINGRRVVAGVGGDSAVDVNNIPTALIENVEVITGGASAVYGSEAIAGAVNIILKDDFEGLEVRAQTGATSEKDNNRHLFSVTGGFNFGNNGNLTLNAQFDKDNGLRSRSRSISAEDNPFRSSFVPQGLFSTSNNTWTYGPNNVLKNSFVNGVDGFNRNAERYISVPLQRTLLTGLGHLNLTDNTEAFWEASYSSVESRSSLEPLATDNSDATQPDGNEYAGLTLDNPFIPAAIRQDMIDGGDTELGFRKRMAGVFDRSNVTSRNFHRVVLGLKGTLADQYNWDAYAQLGKTGEDVKSETGLRNRYFFALDAITNPSNGQPMCRDAGARADGCMPFNPFGFNSVSQGAIDYLRNGQYDTYEAKIRQKVVGTNITGPIMDVPAGEWRFAAGLEHRREESSEEYSAETQVGNTLGNALTNTFGAYEVSEAYVESIFPLLTDAPFARSLELEAAVRLGNYTTVGTVTNWKAGLTWAPNDSLRFRAVYANAVRAPNIAELYDGQSQTFPSGLEDPCEGVTAATAGAVAGYCRSLPGFTQNAALNGGVFTYDPNSDLQSIEGYDGGNARLNEETAKTWTAGVVVTPLSIPSLSFTIDWYQIKIQDAIAIVPRQYIIDQCVNSLGVSDLCSFITREGANPIRPRSPGTLFQIDSGPINSAAIESSGVDVGARYAYSFTSGHKAKVGLTYSYLSKLTLQPLAGEDVQDNRGQLNGDGRLGAGFKHRANLSLGYEIGNLSANWRVNYQSSIVDTLPNDLPIPAYTYHDMQLRYAFGTESEFEVFAGVDNVFDKKPPLVDQNQASNITGTETAAESYDPIGRFMYVGIGIKL
jgi:iron complex outermembrane recepter protein